MVAIKTEGISKSYGSIQALSDVSCEVEAGQVVGLLGPNGAGKTTLMKILTGYIEPDEGTAEIAGADVITQPLRAQRKIGYLPENAPLYREMVVQEYLKMMAELRDISEADFPRLFSEAVVSCAIDNVLTRPISQLSKGYRQRVGLAQAIMHKPELLILDEPTTGLDPTQIAEIRHLIKRLSKDTTIILSTHILSEVEASCDRVLVIMAGKLRADSKIAELRAANSALVSVEEAASGVKSTLLGLAGVNDVEIENDDTVGKGWTTWRVTGSRSDDLCPDIFDTVKKQGWRMSQLRPAPKTLESIFKELATTAEVR